LKQLCAFFPIEIADIVRGMTRDEHLSLGDLGPDYEPGWGILEIFCEKSRDPATF